MAERLISPGVFTVEKDLSFLPQGIAEIGAAFIGPTSKGPAFRPVTVESQEQFTALFGDTTPDFYAPYAVQNYLREANRATVVRILGLDGYDNAIVESAILSISGSGGQYPIGVLFPSRRGVTINSVSVGAGAASSSSQFSVTISSSLGNVTYTSMSVDPTSIRYFAKVLGTANTTNQGAFTLLQFPKAAESLVTGALVGSGSMSATLESNELLLSGSIWGTYRQATTPWIRSQQVGSAYYNLFKFHTLTDGTSANTSVKVSVASIRPDPAGTGYGTFSILVRDFNDTDAKTSVIEQFDGLTLDPNSANYIARRIGTARPVIDANNDVYMDGEYPNKSKYVYVEMDLGAADIPIEVLPYGFEALAAPLNMSTVPAPTYITTRYYTPAGGSTPVANNKIYYGLDFSSATSVAYLNPLPSGSIDAAGTTIKSGVGDSGFDLLLSLTGSDLTDVGVSSNLFARKFTVPFQNGFDGENPAVVRATGASITATNTQGFDLSDAGKSGARAYKRCLDMLVNQDVYDINMLVTPGVVYSLHPYIITNGIDMVETRGDAFYILDGSPLGATVSAATSDVEDLDTNYAGTYFPWVKVRDANTNKEVWTPPSVVMPNVFAFNDRVAAEWFAPAGLNRGGIDIALTVRTRLDQANRDVLYEARVNPIASFPAQGIVTWGQKTLQTQASALDRINVRRLLIAVKKYIASVSRYLVFEQNVDGTRQRFLSIVNPYLQSVQERSGLYAFRVVMDESNNTSDIIDRNMLVGQIYLQPTKTAEFIQLEFNVLPTGAVFPTE